MKKIKEIVVGSVDILGISNILESSNGSEKARKILYNAWVNTGNVMYKEPDKEAKKLSMFWGSIKFGDSVYFFGNPNDSVDSQTQFIIARIGSLIAFGVYHLGILFRGGIAKGDLLIDVVNIPTFNDNETQTIYIGNSISRSHKLEIYQNWIGGAVSGDIDCKKCMEYLVDYKIPINSSKFEDKYLPRYAINWIKIAKNIEGIEIDVGKTIDMIYSIAKEIGDVEKKEVKEKLENTKDFVKKILGGK